MRRIERIFVHCTDSPQWWGVKELEKEFKRKGWQNPGYHYVVTVDGKVHQMLADDQVSNGVYGFNLTSINVSYVGGYMTVDGKKKHLDNRTPEQKESLLTLLRSLRKEYPKAKIMGHRSIWGESTPKKWKKVCPCFNAEAEYKEI